MPQTAPRSRGPGRSWFAPLILGLTALSPLPAPASDLWLPPPPADLGHSPLGRNSLPRAPGNEHHDAFNADRFQSNDHCDCRARCRCNEQNNGNGCHCRGFANNFDNNCGCRNGNGCRGNANGCPCLDNGCACNGWNNGWNGRNNNDEPDSEYLDMLRRADPGLHAGGLLRDRPWITAGPSIPEPMVFDMVRPMHAARGELEVNVLAVFPLRRGAAPVDWAPEVEYAVADGFAFEFEVPYEDTRMEALKFAMQYTFGTGFDNRVIHGFHGFYEYGFEGKVSRYTSLYMVGMRFDETWSVLGMFGFRSTVLKEDRENFTELVQNVSVFADVTDDWIVGVETNMAHNLIGPSSLLIVPQAHWEMSDSLTLQFGAGLQATGETAYPVAAFRLIYEF